MAEKMILKYITFAIGIMWINYPQTADALPVSLFYNAALNLKSNVMEQEIWTAIKGYENYYHVSNFGKVKNIKRNRNLNFKPNTGGYIRVNLTKNKVYKSLSIHRLVGLHFIANPENKPCLNHKDGNKLNNHYLNLEWCTHSENTNHAFRIGLHKGGSFGKFGFDNPKSKPVIQYDKNGNYMNTYGSAMEAMRITRVDNCSLTRVCKNQQLTAGGYIWKHKIDG